MARHKPRGQCMICGRPLPWPRMICAGCARTAPGLPSDTEGGTVRPRPLATARYCRTCGSPIAANACPACGRTIPG